MKLFKIFLIVLFVLSYSEANEKKSLRDIYRGMKDYVKEKLNIQNITEVLLSKKKNFNPLVKLSLHLIICKLF